MPTKVGKPNTNSQLKTAMNMGSIPRASAQKAGRSGQVASNSDTWKAPRSGGNSSAPKRSRGRRMY